MHIRSFFNAIFAFALLVSVWGCRYLSETKSNSSNRASNTVAEVNNSSTSSASESDDGMITSAQGTEKEKPAAGKANIQGKVLYNEQPAAGIEVTLCTKFNQFLGGCGGEKYKAKTDASGEYLIKDVPPGIYEGLVAKVFDSNYYVFATTGIISAAKYRIDAGKTFFAPDANLFKDDLKILNPKAGSKIGPDNIEVKWEAYPNAAYYKFSIYADNSTGAKPEYDYINKRTDGLSYSLDKPLSPGSYTVSVTAYNANDVKLAEGPDDIKFTVK